MQRVLVLLARNRVIMGKLDGKVALISGGARGQGAAEASTFAQEGAKIVFGDIRDVEGRQIETDIRARGGQAVYVHLDVTNEADWRLTDLGGHHRETPTLFPSTELPQRGASPARSA